MLLGIDHVVLAVLDLDEAAGELERTVGLAATGGGRHPALGTENRLAWLGDSYVELVAIADRIVAESSWLGIPATAALERGGGFVTWAVATDAIATDVAALQATGARFGDPIPGRRDRPDGAVVRWQLAIGGDLGPAEPPFLIEHDPKAAEWTEADRATHRAFRHPIGGPVRLEVLELPVGDVTASSMALARAVDLRFRPSLAGGGSRDANLGRHVIRLRPGIGAASAPRIHLASPAGDDRTVEALGCRWVVRRKG